VEVDRSLQKSSRKQGSVDVRTDGREEINRSGPPVQEINRALPCPKPLLPLDFGRMRHPRDSRRTVIALIYVFPLESPGLF
jgi:hypothetical protein